MILNNGESLFEVLSYTALGILIVFAVLVILMLVLMLMKFFAPKEKVVAEKNIIPKVASKIEEKASDEDEEELVAVLTAAIASVTGTKVSNLRIRSYKRI